MTTGTAEMDTGPSASAGAREAPAVAGGSVAVKKKNLLALKRMLDDDDDSSDDEPPPSAEPEGARARRPSGSRKTRDGANGQANSEKKKPKKNSKAALDADVKVRSERLQLRAAMIESTVEKSGAQTKKPTTPRKRRRTGSDSMQPEADKEVVQSKAEGAPKRARLTRKDSRDALKKKREEVEKAQEQVVRDVEKAELAIAKVVEQGVATENRQSEQSGGTRDEQAASEPTETAANAVPHEDKNIESADALKAGEQGDEKEKAAIGELREKDTLPPRRQRPRGGEDETEPIVEQSEEEATATVKRRPRGGKKEMDSVADRNGKEAPVAVKRRPRAISEDSVGSEPAPKADKIVEMANRGEKKRKRLKRPLAEATASENGSHPRQQTGQERASKPKPSKRLASAEQREKPSGTERDTYKEKRSSGDGLRGGKIKGGGRRDGNHDKLTVSGSLDDFLRMEKKSKAGVSELATKRSKNLSRNSGGVSLDDYIKEQEQSREAQKGPIDEKTEVISERLDTDEGSGKNDVVETATDGDAPDAVGKEDLNLVGEGAVDEHGGPVGETSKETEPKSASVPRTKEEGEEDDDEEGAVSDHDIVPRAETSSAESVETKQQEPAGDAVSFVIPKKRVVTESSGDQSIKRDAVVLRPKPVPLQAPAEGVTVAIPAPSPSPVFSVDMNLTQTDDTSQKKPRKKNVVPPKMMPLTQREKDFMRLAKKTNSLLKAATVSGTHGSSSQVSKMSPFGCTSDRYGVLVESGSTYTEPTTRMACPTRKKIQDGNHPPDYFGVAMKMPPCARIDESTGSDGHTNANSAIPCYETLEFERPEDRTWYQKRMYGTPFVPQLLRERVTLVMRNARYVRKSAGLQFNMQRDKEEFETQLANRYKINSSTPRCDILFKNWQLLSNGRTTFVFLHYMNREDALLARARFKDDEGQPLIIKGESRASELAMNGNVRPGVSSVLSPPPHGSPQPRRRSRSGSNGHSPPRRPEQRGREGRDRFPPPPQADRGPRPPRDRSRNRGGRRQPFNGSEPRNGNRYGPRSPPRRQTRSRSQSPTHPRYNSGQHDQSTQPSVVVSSQQSDSQDDMSTLSASQPSQDSQFQSQASSTHEHLVEEGESLSQEAPDQDMRPPGIEFSQPPRGRGRSRSRSRPRGYDDRHPHPHPHSIRRGSEDQSFQRDRRNSGEYFGRGRDMRRGRPPPPPLGRDGREHGRFNDHYHHQQHHDDWQSHPRDFDRHSHHGADPHRRYHHDGRRFH